MVESKCIINNIIKYVTSETTILTYRNKHFAWFSLISRG